MNVNDVDVTKVSNRDVHDIIKQRNEEGWKLIGPITTVNADAIYYILTWEK